jgi:hypothetical protein
LGIEERTVKAHVGKLKKKTGADNRIKLLVSGLNRPMQPRKNPSPGHAETRESDN